MSSIVVVRVVVVVVGSVISLTNSRREDSYVCMVFDDVPAVRRVLASALVCRLGKGYIGITILFNNCSLAC